MSDMIYQASVFTRTVKYTNFNGESQSTELFFALDPIQLMSVIAGFEIKKKKRSGNPAKRDEVAEITDEQQIKFVRDIVVKSAGFPSKDGESWEPFEDFENTIAGKAFLTKLTASDNDRREFTEKVVLDPFRAFVSYAKSDPSNTKSELDQLEKMQEQLEAVFRDPVKEGESLDDRRDRLRRELAEMEGPAEGTQGDNGPTT